MSIYQLDPSTETETLVDIFRQRAEHQPQRQAYAFLSQKSLVEMQLTYAELDQKARILGAVLQSKGAVGQPVLILHQPGLEYIIAFYGCLYAGAIAVPAYPPHSPRLISRIQAIITDTQAHIILSDSTLLPNLQQYLVSSEIDAECIATDVLAEYWAEQWQVPVINGASLAFLQYTSGSTGTPKGVMVSHQNIIDNLQVIHESSMQNEQSYTVSWLPPYHDLGLVCGILYPMYIGFPAMLLSPVTFLQRPFRWLKAISDCRATMTMAPNFSFDLCCRKITAEQRQQLDLSTLEVIANGGEPLRKETLDRFHATFRECGLHANAMMPGYGMAEMTLLIACSVRLAPTEARSFDQDKLKMHQVEAVDEHVPGAQAYIGYPCISKKLDILIVNPEDGKKSLPNQVGEICVRGTSVAQGYWNKEEATQSTFHYYTSDTNEGPFLRTGDLGFYYDNILFVTGRQKDLIIIHGSNYYPQDIEATTEKAHETIRFSCCAAFSVERENREQLVVIAEIEPRYKPAHTFSATQDTTLGRKPLDPEEVMQAIREAVMEEHELQIYDLVLVKAGSVLKTSSGKVQRRACQADYLAESLSLWDE